MTTQPTHVLLLKTPSVNMQIPFSDLESAMSKALECVRKRYCRIEDSVLMLGPAAFLNVLSLEEAKEVDKDARAAAATGGLTLPTRFAIQDDDHVLFMQHPAAVGTLPPLRYPNRAALEGAVSLGLNHGYIPYVIKEDHDHLFVILGEDTLLMLQTGKQYHEQRRIRMAQQMRQQAQQAPRSGIIMP